MPRTKRNSAAADNAKVEHSVPPEVQAVRKIFTEAQRTIQCHERCSDSLPRLLSKHESAWDEYFSCVKRILLVSKRDPGVERLVQFVTLAAISNVNASLFDRTVEFLLMHSGAADKAVRFRCCQLLASLTKEYTQLPQVSEEDLDCFVDVLLPRLRDKVAAVRVQAVGALRPFQFELEAGDDEEALAEDKVRSELMRVMVSDSSPDARQAALAAVTKTIGMFDKLVLRTQDVKESVRKAAFRTLGADVSSKHLQPQQRVTLLKRGFSDSSESVVEACRFMLCVHWFRDADYDPVELLQRLDIVQVEKVAEMVVTEIVRLGLRAEHERGDPSLGMGLTLQDAKALRQAASRRVELAPAAASSVGGGDDGGGGGGGGVSAEEALYARVQAEVVKEDKIMSAGEKETRLEAILTDTTTLCGQIEAVAQEMKELVSNDDVLADGKLFVLEQLLKLAARADFTEEAGRRRLVTLLQQLLLDASLLHHVVEPSMEALAAAHTSDADFVRIIAELVSDISDLIHNRTTADVPTQNASLDASFASVMGNLTGAAADGTPNRSLASIRSAVRAAIPKNFVKDRARAIEGIQPMARMDEDGGPAAGYSGGGDGNAASSEDEFMDALSHHSASGGDDDNESIGGDALLRQAAAGTDEGDAHGGVAAAEDGKEDAESDTDEADMRRLFRILDILSVLLSKTKRTLAKDATLTAFEEVIMDVFKWTAETLPTVCPDLRSFGPLLREQAVEVLGKYSLLGETAAVRHFPMLLQIAQCEQEATTVRACAMQALSDLSLIFRTAVLGSAGDVVGMFADTLKDRNAARGMIAVAAEAVSRLLFFELAHDPELLARLVVLYFEKGSAADPSTSASSASADDREGKEQEEEDTIREDAKAIGSSVRLSQILGVYFRSLPSASPRVRDMLFESVPHVMRVLRDIAELNAAPEEVIQDDGEERPPPIQVSAKDVVKFVLELLMMHQEESASRVTPVPEKPPLEGEGEEKAIEGTPEKANESSSAVAAAGGATGHVALCITDELWTLSGIDVDGFPSDLALVLAKVLASLPLPEDDQVTLKRLRKNVDRLESLCDNRLDAKVSRILTKYAEVLLSADLTPDDRMTSDEDGDSDDDDASPAGGKVGGRPVQEGGKGIAKNVQTRKRRSQLTAPPSRRPARQSKVIAQERLAYAERAEAAAADQDTSSSSEEEEEEDEEEDDTGKVKGETPAADREDGIRQGEAEGSGDDEDDDDDEEEDEDEGYESAATKVSSPAKGTPTGRRRSSRVTVTPLSEISNSPFGGVGQQRA